MNDNGSYDALIQAIKQVQWVCRLDENSDHFCPWCGNYKATQKHANGCIVNSIKKEVQ